jgi:ribosomal protein S4
MMYPGYFLNPGDMFQVEPDRVLFGTGAPKDASERRAGRLIRKRAKKAKEASAEEDGTEEPAQESLEIAAATNDTADTSSEEAVEAKRKIHKVSLKELLDNAKAILGEHKAELSGKRKEKLREFTRSVRYAMGKVDRNDVQDLDSELETLVSQLAISAAPPASASTVQTGDKGTAPVSQTLTEEERKALREVMREARENPIDPRKPYATPWRPRPYMSPFAFIPRYLEVNQNICSAVYLRHPVARPGLAEVPTPFTPETSQLAFNWYLRRR